MPKMPEQEPGGEEEATEIRVAEVVGEALEIPAGRVGVILGYSLVLIMVHPAFEPQMDRRKRYHEVQRSLWRTFNLQGFQVRFH